MSCNVFTRRLAWLAVALAGCASVPPPTPMLPRPVEPSPPPAPTAASLRPSLSLSTPPADSALPTLDPANNVYFEVGSASLNDAGRATLAGLVARLKESPRRQILLIGHTDDTGSREFNVALAQRRVASVADWLEGQGVPARQIRRVSYGNELASELRCQAPICLAAQRRVELHFTD